MNGAALGSVVGAAAAVAGCRGPRAAAAAARLDLGGVLSLDTKETSRQKGIQSSQVPVGTRGVAARRGRVHRSLVSGLRAIGLEEQARQVDLCGRLMVSECSACGGAAGRQVLTCKHRLCPYCAGRRGARYGKLLVPFIGGFMNPVFLTLTLRNMGDLGAMDKKLRESWKRLRRSEDFKAAFRGGFCFEEVTYNYKSREWHVHMHCLLDGWMAHSALSAQWLGITGDSMIVHLEQVNPDDREGAIREACKYPFKVSGIVGDADVLRQVLEQFRGRRMMWSFGSCYGVMGQLEEAVEEEEAAAISEEEEEAEFCPSCGAAHSMAVKPRVWWSVWSCEPVGGGWWRQLPVRVVIEKPPLRGGFGGYG